MYSEVLVLNWAIKCQALCWGEGRWMLLPIRGVSGIETMTANGWAISTDEARMSETRCE